MTSVPETQPVRFGISLPNRAVLFGVSPQVLLETAEHAEASGFFDSVWVGDNLLSKPRLESIVTLAAIAARTRRLKLGEVCLASFTLRHPLIVAIQWASLDVLSGGRTILAVCIGGSATMGPQFAMQLSAMGVQSSERLPRMEEGDLLPPIPPIVSENCCFSGPSGVLGPCPIVAGSTRSRRSRRCRSPLSGVCPSSSRRIPRSLGIP